MIFDSVTRLPSRSGWDLHPTRAETGSFTIAIAGATGLTRSIAQPDCWAALRSLTPARLRQSE